MNDHHLLLSGSTLDEALRNIVTAAPLTRLVFPQRNGETTVKDLLADAETTARSLVTAGVCRGEVVGLIGSSGPELLAGLFGIVMAGAAATVLPQPQGLGADHRRLDRMSAIVQAAHMRHMLVDSHTAELADHLADTCTDLRLVRAESRAVAELPTVAPEDIAVVQFTSGSTAQPRGVTLSHRAVLAGLRAIAISGGFGQSDVFVQWVPYHHDLGLFGHLAQVLNGIESHVFEPTTFLRRPEEVLRYFSACRGTVLTGPNFSYDLMLWAATPELLRDLDLSSWRLAFNGAEPVSAATVRAFTDVFARAGAAPTVMYPVYGMAEATLAVAFPQPGALPRMVCVDRDELSATGQVREVPESDSRAKVVVSVGAPVLGVEVRLVDEHAGVLGPGRLGELQIRGDAVTTGYLDDAPATAAVFDGSWLRTGDLAFQLGGDYFVAGRRKEMIIVHGQNYFPDDAEIVARTVPGVHRGHCVAVAENDGSDGEFLGVIAETTLEGAPRAALEDEIRRRIVTAIGMPHVRVHTVPPRWLTRTTSGKWQRLHAAARLADQEKKAGTGEEGMETTAVDHALTATNQHYDLPPEVFERFLGRRMKYTCGIYDNVTESLDAAQDAKLRFIAERLALHGGESVLDIGTGWGALAFYLVEEVGCTVTAVTPSAVQARWVREHAAERGLTNRLTVLEQSVYDLDIPSGTFDATALVGVIEHLPDHRRAIDIMSKAIRRGGRMYVSASCFRNDELFGEYSDRPGSRHVAEQIFGYAVLRPPSELLAAIEDAGLSLVGVRDLTWHYHKTIDDWLTGIRGAAGAIDDVHPGLSNELVRYLETTNAGWGYTTKHYGITATRSRHGSTELPR
ncbi:AMP-binding protein [Nocardia sp. CWNU-33]|uniref:AMP-binding protein n=1 Tax=Nocardia sp. CWNU-33 TaxID=3392117 RepID=UPI00398E9D56